MALAFSFELQTDFEKAAENLAGAESRQMQDPGNYAHLPTLDYAVWGK